MSLMDFPTLLGEAIGSDATTGGIILTAGILAMIGLVLAVCKIDVMGNLVILLVTLAALTAIGWCPIWLMVLAVLAISAMFAKQLATWLQPQGGAP